MFIRVETWVGSELVQRQIVEEPEVNNPSTLNDFFSRFELDVRNRVSVSYPDRQLEFNVTIAVSEEEIKRGLSKQ